MTEFLSASSRSDRSRAPSDGHGGAVASGCQHIDWYAPGQSTVVEVAGVRLTVRLVGRKGRRARIAITAPAGAKFKA